MSEISNVKEQAGLASATCSADAPNPCRKCGNIPIQAENSGVFVVACLTCQSQCDSFISMQSAITNWNNHNPPNAKLTDHR